MVHVQNAALIKHEAVAKRGVSNKSANRRTNINTINYRMVWGARKRRYIRFRCETWRKFQFWECKIILRCKYSLLRKRIFYTKENSTLKENFTLLRKMPFKKMNSRVQEGRNPLKRTPLIHRVFFSFSGGLRPGPPVSPNVRNLNYFIPLQFPDAQDINNSGY